MCKDDEAKVVKRRGKEEAEEWKSKSFTKDDNGCRGSRNWQACAAASDKVNDFQFVSILECGCFPQRAGNDLKVQLHGYAVRLHAELGDQGRNGQAVRKLALFAIDVEDHGKKRQQLALSN